MQQQMHEQTTATWLGLVAVLLWSSLASITTYLTAIPPLQLAAMSFAIAACVGFAWARCTGEPLAAIRAVPPGYWLLGVYGLLGYHALYFYSFQHAPALEANLLNYLWPLLIVVFSGALPAALGGRSLRWWHIGGALLGFAGSVLVLWSAGGGQDGFALATVGPGHFAAIAAAVIWASYSVGSRLYSAVPSIAVMGTCAVTSVGAFVASFAFESPVWPSGIVAWTAIMAQGLGPVGLAFYLWDRGMKRGNMRLVAVGSYATPLLSSLLLAVLGRAEASPMLWLAALLLTFGAALGGADMWLVPRLRAGNEKRPV
jgi:drug/metabolite transporter (DMT)-like permease